MSVPSMRVGPALKTSGLSFEMAAAIIVHKNRSTEWTSGSSVSNGLVSLHDVRHDEKRGVPVIGPGRLCDRATLESLLRDMAGNAKTHLELLPPELLFADSTQLLWHCAARRETIYFSTADNDFNRDVTGQEVSHPPLLFQASASGLRVLALADSGRPKAETRVFLAPYCNLYVDGSMCRGDVKLPATLLPNSISQWQRMFFDSRFTHSNLLGGAKLTRFPGGHNALWRAMREAPTFPTDTLTPTKWTLDHVLNRRLQ